MTNIGSILLVDTLAIFSIGVALLPLFDGMDSAKEACLWTRIILLVVALGFLPGWIMYSVMILFMAISFYFSVSSGTSWHEGTLKFRCYLQVICIICVAVAS